MPNDVLVCNLKVGGCGFIGYDDDWDTDETGITGVPLCPTCHMTRILVFNAPLASP